MSLINTQSNTQPTLQDLQAQFKAEITEELTRLFQGLNGTTVSIFNRIWKGSGVIGQSSLTPQQSLDAFGTDAASLFQLFALVQNLLNTAVPNTMNLVPPFQYTINDDGTVVVGEPIKIS